MRISHKFFWLKCDHYFTYYFLVKLSLYLFLLRLFQKCLSLIGTLEKFFSLIVYTKAQLTYRYIKCLLIRCLLSVKISLFSSFVTKKRNLFWWQVVKPKLLIHLSFERPEIYCMVCWLLTVWFTLFWFHYAYTAVFGKLLILLLLQFCSI